MNKYEVMYILKTPVDESAKEALVEKYSASVAEFGGEVEAVNKMGIKKFAYPINFKNEGYYVLMTYQANAEFTAELERRMRIDENVVRFMVTKIK